MNVTIINDCRDANALGRQTTRTEALLNCAITFIGVANDLEAAGNIIDIVDALDENEGIILVNVAPRNGKAKKWHNGTPFGYFRYKNILVLASVDGYTLSLVKKFGLIDHINVLEIPQTLEQLIKAGALREELRDQITRTQFRSYDYLPRVAAYLATGKELEGERLDINDIADVPNTVWWIDNFGNCKTTLIHEDIKQAESIDLSGVHVPYYSRLKDVPDREMGIISGSSGIDNRRFLEIVVQGRSAHDALGLVVGDKIL